MKTIRFLFCLTFLLASIYSKAQYIYPVLFQNNQQGNLIRLNNELLMFRGFTKELYKTDGLTAPVLVKTINSNSYIVESRITDHLICNGLLYFSLHEISSGGNQDKFEVWRTDGTQAGTYMLDSTNNINYFFCGSTMTSVGNAFFFVGHDSIYCVLPNNTKLGVISDYTYPNHTRGNIFSYRNYLFFNHYPSHTIYAWDTLTGNYTPMMPSPGFSNGIDIDHFITHVYNDTLYVTHGDLGGKLYWVAPNLSYGITDTTFFAMEYLGNVNGRMLLTGGRIQDSLLQTQFYTFDLAQKIVTPINPGSTPFQSMGYVYSNDTIAYFSANDSTHGVELWKTDGTLQGTSLTADFSPGTSNTTFYGGPTFGDNVPFFAFSYLCGTSLYLSASPSSSGQGFRIYDGSTFSTQPLRSNSEYVYGFTELNGEVFFNLYNNPNVSTYTYKFGCGASGACTALINSFGNNILCYGDCTAGLEANPNGTAPFSFSWSPSGGTDSLAQNLCAGSYTVTITDNGGCSSMASTNISGPSMLMDTIVTSYENCNCSFTVSASGGTNGYTYQWCNGSTAPQIFNCTPGECVVMIADANGCSTQDTVFVNPPPALTLTVQPTGTSCIGCTDGSISGTASGGSGTYTYSLQPGGFTNLAGIFDNLSAGVYTCCVTDSLNCTTCFSDTVQEDPTRIHAAFGNNIISVFPSPAGTQTTLYIDGRILVDPVFFTLTDVTGNTQRFFPLTKDEMVLSLEDLSPGIYFYRITTKENLLGKGKLVVTGN